MTINLATGEKNNEIRAQNLIEEHIISSEKINVRRAKFLLEINDIKLSTEEVYNVFKLIESNYSDFPNNYIKLTTSDNIELSLIEFIGL
jgi:hypothetical protein